MLLPFDRPAFLGRIALARQQVYGDRGISALAEALGIPAQTWVNYESGVMIPDAIILKFVCLTGASPHWLLSGEGQPFAAHAKPIIQFG